MFKNVVLVIILCINSFILLAQKNVTVGKPYGVIDAPEKYYFTQDGEILTVKTTRNSLTLQKMDAVTLAFKKIKLYDDFPKGFSLERISAFKNRYYVFYSVYINEEEQLFYREIDFASGNFKGPGQKLLSVSDKLSGTLTRAGFMKVAVTDKYSFFNSYDQSLLVVQYRLKPKVRDDSESYDEIGTSVFDADLQEKWNGILKMPYTEQKMDNLDYAIDKKGDVYIVARVYNDDTAELKKRGEENANYHLEVLKASAPGGTITSSAIEVGDKFINTLWLYEGPDGNMIGGGFYNKGQKHESDNADGIMIVKLDSNGKLQKLITHEIPVDILNQYASGKEVRKNKKKNEDDRAEFEDLTMRGITIQEDGSMVVKGQQSFSLSHSSYSSTGGSRTWYTYHSNDMLVTKIAPDGSLAWMKKLPKRQMSSRGFNGLSYHYFRGNREHYFIFMDNEKNLELSMDKVPATHMEGSGGFLMAYKVNDATGEVSKSLLVDSRDANGTALFQIDPTRMLAPAPATIVFEAYKKQKEDVLVKIVLE